ncbi:ABC transporter permease [Bradyrhizobium sp. 24]|uniref:ABC transporter permease n=1 Tax=unclassified Bradyrhizobium TaxID=2631580 RepID=UPI001FFAE916|nr:MULTISPECIES: ABC transporter permease [unclassified Bradyrhizobium]MCK1302768.1 ABC transporter permease [Bradyrhizobium sp. 37]MCK1380476.1 ABC transporter permease [Bradyrhizobium sp. 24]MCK1770877.1 ABC transporter permease [Bradyrhizobium sp. 134]
MSITVNTGRTSGPERSVAAELVKPLTGVIAVRKSPEGRRDIFATCVVVVVLLAAMEITSRFVPDYIMPSPVTVWKAARELFFSDPYHVAVTLVRLAISVMIAMITGVLIGLAMGMFPSVRPYLKAIVVIDTGIPALSWMLIAVFWFKNPESRIFFILLVILLPFYALNVYEGVRALPKELVDMIESFRPSRWQVLRYLILPHIVAYIFLTTKSVIGYAIRMVIFAELVASAVGIGARMNLSQSTFRIDQVLAWTFFLVILNLLLQAFVNSLEKISLKWRAEATVR